ncbi:La-domain-containing protein [Lichtheimia hyalospora FSU 10163]|nr:La-domain-containing protein [Lichtheimia hyalospora FSU 10163]
MAEVAPKILKQVEFYFSDSNLPFDKFLWTLKEKNSEGWVPLATIASFKKMKMITEDLPTVVAAIRDQPSELVELDESGENIRRKTPVVQQESISRSIYAKGFPLVDENAENPKEALLQLQDKIDELFSEHGKVLAVRLRKTDGKPSKFKGSVFIEFSTPEEAENAVTKSLQYDGNDLLLKTKKAYVDEKAELYKDAPRTYKRPKFNAFRNNNDRPNNDRSKSNKSKNDRSKGDKKRNTKPNYRLMTFDGAKDLDANTIKDIVGKDEVASVTFSGEGAGYIELNEGKNSRDKTLALREKSKEEVKNVNFRYADGEASATYANLGKSDPQVGEKRKAEDNE